MRVFYLGLGTLAAVIGCTRGDKTVEAEGRADVQPVPVDIQSSKEPLDCPDGTTNHSDDKGDFEWCERPNGTMHGPRVQRQRCTGLQIHRSTYRDGVRHGDSVAWDIVLPVGDDLHGTMSVCDLLSTNPALAAGLLRVQSSLETYRDGKREGLATTWRYSGKKSGERRYRGGLKHGRWRQWYESGALIGSYEMERGTGTEVWWHDDSGRPWFEWERRHGNRHGRYRRWHDNGQLALEGGFADDLPHGTWKQWSTDGTLLGSYEMTNGTGTERTWHDNGRLKMEEPMLDGTPTGTTRGWLPNGELMLETTRYVDHEVMRSYEDGVLSFVTTFIRDERDKDVRHGDETYYDADGNVTRVDRYEHGKLVSSQASPPSTD